MSIEVVYACSVCGRRCDATKEPPIALTDGEFACPNCATHELDEEDE